MGGQGSGRPPIPAERRRLRGNTSHGARPLPDQANVVQLPSQHDLKPDKPRDLGPAGNRLWEMAWHPSVVWLSPLTDLEAVIHACSLADDVHQTRQNFRLGGLVEDGRLLASLSKEFSSALAALGFDPVSRTRMGVAEVVRQSKIEKLSRGD